MRFAIPFVLLASVAFAEDITQFRGPGGLGISGEKNLPVTWGEKENVRWKVDLPGRGLSNPVTAQGRVFVTAASGANRDRLHVMCFDQKDGKLLWDRQFWATGGTQCNAKTTMAAPTPATDGKFVYALFATADLFCLDLDGNLQWTRSFVGDYPTVGNNVGMAASPVIADDVVVIHMENIGESFALGVDRTRGTNRWRVDRPKVINWNTPFVRKEAGKTQVLLMTPGSVTAYDPATGQELWAHTQGKFATSPSIMAADGLIFVPGEKFSAIRLGAGGPEVVWQNAKLNVGYATPCLVGGRLYTVANNGVAMCADAKTGKVEWTHRLEGTFAASPMSSEGHVYFTSESGTTYVMEAGPAAKVLATNELKDLFMASPVASGGAIYLRSDKHLWCLSAK
jgi:outer membrane protein assembly factor BamB